MIKNCEKLNYDKAEIKITEFENTDLIVTSGDGWSGSLGGDGNLSDPGGWT